MTKSQAGGSGRWRAVLAGVTSLCLLGALLSAQMASRETGSQAHSEANSVVAQCLTRGELGPELDACLGSAVRELAAAGQVDVAVAATMELARMDSRYAGSVCHEDAHEVAALAVGAVGVLAAIDVPYVGCAGGHVHGVFTAIRAMTPAQVLDVVRVCLAAGGVEGWQREFHCYHGLGHALVVALEDGALPQALQACSAAPDGQAQRVCAGGILMALKDEIMGVTQMVNGPTNLLPTARAQMADLQVSQQICSQVTDEDLARPCWGQLSHLWPSLGLSESAHVQTCVNSGRRACATGLGTGRYMFAEGQQDARLAGMLTGCAALGLSAAQAGLDGDEFRTYCHVGALTFLNGDASIFGGTARGCRLLAEADRRACDAVVRENRV
jgi:hypothetical protein